GVAITGTDGQTWLNGDFTTVHGLVFLLQRVGQHGTELPIAKLRLNTQIEVEVGFFGGVLVRVEVIFVEAAHVGAVINNIQPLILGAEAVGYVAVTASEGQTHFSDGRAHGGHGTVELVAVDGGQLAEVSNTFQHCNVRL